MAITESDLTKTDKHILKAMKPDTEYTYQSLSKVCGFSWTTVMNTLQKANGINPPIVSVEKVVSKGGVGYKFLWKKVK